MKLNFKDKQTKSIDVVPPATSPSTLRIAEIRIDQSFSGTSVAAIFSNSRINSFSEYTLMGSMGFSVMSASPDEKIQNQSAEMEILQDQYLDLNT